MLNDKLVQITYYLTRGLLVVSFVSFLFFRQWETAFMTALIFVLIITPSILKNKYDFYFPHELDVSIGFFVFLTLFLGSLRNYYERYFWWDKVLHFQSGILLGIASFVLIYILNSTKVKKIKMSPGFISLFSVTFSLSMSVVWEVYEYFADMFFGFNMQRNGLPDTMEDLMVNAVGAIIVATIAYFWMKKESSLPFTPADIG
jgi:VanZ family protein